MSDYIPKDILGQILKCIPVKTLLQFRSVCKSWKQLIDSPSFIQCHLAVQKHCRIIVDFNTPEFLLLNPQTLPVLKTLTGPAINDKPKQYRVIGTLHGIICLHVFDSDYQVMLWNPLINKFSIVPNGSGHCHWNEQTLSSHTVDDFYSAFWIDPSNNDYKIIIFDFVFRKPDCLYSSIDQVWKEIAPAQFMDHFPYHGGPAVVIGTVAYWRCYQYESDDTVVAYIVYFDFDLETFGDLIKVPLVIESFGTHYTELFICQGDLSLLYFDGENTCKIYSRQRGSWVNMFEIEVPSCIVGVLWCLEDEMEESRENSRYLATTTSQLVLCDTKANFVSLKSGIECPVYNLIAYDFVESLFFPIAGDA